MKKIFLLLLLWTKILFCQIENKIQITEGIGSIDFKVCFDKKNIYQRFGKSDKCEGWTGKYIKNETTGVIKDNRKKEYKIWKNLFCKDSLGVRVLFKKNKIYSITFLNPNYITSKGISIGDSREDVLKKYGGNYDSPKVNYYQIGINFVFENDRVTEIEIISPRK